MQAAEPKKRLALVPRHMCSVRYGQETFLPLIPLLAACLSGRREGSGEGSFVRHSRCVKSLGESPLWVHNYALTSFCFAFHRADVSPGLER